MLPRLVAGANLAYAAFALRIRIAILLARTEYDSVAALADRAIALAEASNDDYVLVQVLNVLGAVAFDRATSKLRVPHARAHLSSLDPRDTAPMEDDAREALALVRARPGRRRARALRFAAWYVAGNIERLEIVLGHAHAPCARSASGSGAAGAGREVRRNRHPLESRLGPAHDGMPSRGAARARRGVPIARETGTFNVPLEFLEYDRSIVLDALGDMAGARASYSRYLQLVGASQAGRRGGRTSPPPERRPAPTRALFWKRADRFILDLLGQAIHRGADWPVHCGVSRRTMEKAFVRLPRHDPGRARAQCAARSRAGRSGRNGASVADVATRCGFRSSTTFALEYRKRFGVSPSDSLRAVRMAAR